MYIKYSFVKINNRHVVDSMNNARASHRKRKDKWGNRMALIGITFVVLSLAMVVTYKGSSLKDKDLTYQIREENLDEQVVLEEQRSNELEEYRIYVQTKQYIEKVAKEKLGLVNPNEILLKPAE